MLALGLILCLGGVLRVRGLGAGLWYDEIETLVRYVRQPIGVIITTYDSQNQHMLYSLLAHVATTLFGDGAAALRLPAALFGVASLWAVYWLGSIVTSRRQALLAALLLAVSYHHVWFSQNARGYTALLFFSLVGTGLFLQLLAPQPPGARARAATYALVMALALYTHLMAICVIAAHGMLWAAGLVRARRDDAGARQWLPLGALALSGAFALLFYAPVLPRLVGTAAAPTMQGTGVVWRSPGWLVTELVGGLVRGLPGGVATLAAGVLVAAVGVMSFWRRSPATAAAMLLPAATTAAVLFVGSHNLWPRFFFFAAGFAALIVVRGGFAVAERVAPARGGLAATAAFLLAAAGSAATVPRAWAPKQDYGGARAFLQREARSGDAVVVVDMTRMPYERYYRTGWLAVSSAEELAAVEASHRRTWVAYTFPSRLSVVHPAVWGRLRQAYRVAREFPGTVGGGSIVVMVRQ